MELLERQKIVYEKVDALRKRLPLESALIKQLDVHIETYNDSIEYLTNNSHKLAFIGNVGAGKTTAICHLIGLVEQGKPILSTGSGRTTLCEVEVCQNIDKKIKIEVIPHTKSEILSYLKDFALDLFETQSNEKVGDESSQEGFKLSDEIVRALRNMLQLPIKRNYSDNSRVDEAKTLASQYNSFNEFFSILENRLNLSVRNKTLFTYDDTSSLSANDWLSQNFKAINSATDPNVGLAKRIIINLNSSILGDTACNISVVDTKGVDHTVNRTDLDACFTDSRTISVICSRFNDAPDKTMVSLIKHAKEAGLKDRLSSETVLLVLDRISEAEDVVDVSEAVGDKNIGRDIRKYQVSNDFKQSLQLDDLDIKFMDAKEDDLAFLQKYFLNKISLLRESYYNKLVFIETSIDSIELNFNSETTKNAKLQVNATLDAWLKKSLGCSVYLKEYFNYLIEEIRAKHTYAASLRASVNRLGQWDNFNYYLLIATGARKQVVQHFDSLKDELVILIDNMLSREDLGVMHSLLLQIKVITEKRLGDLYKYTFTEGYSGYAISLRKDIVLWESLINHWGQGSGYKDRVARSTTQWFNNIDFKTPELALSEEIDKRWYDYLKEVQILIGRDKLIN